MIYTYVYGVQCKMQSTAHIFITLKFFINQNYKKLTFFNEMCDMTVMGIYHISTHAFETLISMCEWSI